MGNNSTRPVRVDEIRRRLEERNISQAELARAVGMSKKGIQNILNKVNDPREETLIRIASILGVKWKTLLDEFDGEIEEIGEGEGGIATKTTVDLLLDMRRPGMTPEKAAQFLLSKLGKSIDMADVIRVVILRPEE
jgi:transcriptional regulator with XRE-family HTH domain